jgi:hypothetical protein
MTNLAFVLERGEDVRPPQKLEVGFRRIAADFLQEGLEANHARRCLSPQGGVLTGNVPVLFMIAGAVALSRGAGLI